MLAKSSYAHTARIQLETGMHLTLKFLESCKLGALWNLVSTTVGSKEVLVQNTEPDAIPIASPFSFELLRTMVLAVGLGLGLWIVIRLLQHFTTKRDANINANCEIKILDKRVLGSRVTLYLLEIPGKKVLIAHTPNGLSPLGESPAPTFDAALRSENTKS